MAYDVNNIKNYQQILDLYKQYTGDEQHDDAGMQYWDDQINSGKSMADIERDFQGATAQTQSQYAADPSSLSAEAQAVLANKEKYAAFIAANQGQAPQASAPQGLLSADRGLPQPGYPQQVGPAPVFGEQQQSFGGQTFGGQGDMQGQVFGGQGQTQGQVFGGQQGLLGGQSSGGTGVYDEMWAASQAPRGPVDPAYQELLSTIQGGPGQRQSPMANQISPQRSQLQESSMATAPNWFEQKQAQDAASLEAARMDPRYQGNNGFNESMYSNQGAGYNIEGAEGLLGRPGTDRLYQPTTSDREGFKKNIVYVPDGKGGMTQSTEYVDQAMNGMEKATLGVLGGIATAGAASAFGGAAGGAAGGAGGAAGGAGGGFVIPTTAELAALGFGEAAGGGMAMTGAGGIGSVSSLAAAGVGGAGYGAAAQQHPDQHTIEGRGSLSGRLGWWCRRWRWIGQQHNRHHPKSN